MDDDGCYGCVSEPTGVGDNFASLLPLALPPHTPITSPFTWSIIVQTRIIALSAIASQHHHRPLYTRASPLLRVTYPTPREGGHPFCYPHKFGRPSSPAVFPHTHRRITKFCWGLRIAKPAQASYIQPHDSTVSQRPTGPVLHNGREVRLTGFDTVPADLVILLGLILESRRNAIQLT